MPDFPLLLFSGATSFKPKTKGFPYVLVTPTAAAQGERLGPKFQNLVNTLENQLLRVQHHLLGTNPELTLVLETFGPIQDFLSAVKQIQGLEWLWGNDLGKLPPEFGFFVDDKEENKEKEIPGHAYLVASNAKAMSELHSLFKGWVKNPNTKFPRGLSKLAGVFKHLRDIRYWNNNDRLREGKLLEDWEIRIAGKEQELPFEAELWYRDSSKKQDEVRAEFLNAISQFDGEIRDQYVMSSIAYHGILGVISASKVSCVSEIRDSYLTNCQRVKFFNPVGQCADITTGGESNVDLAQHMAHTPPKSKCIVGLLDGYPLYTHKQLDGRLNIIDPDGLGDLREPQKMQHGTAMASLICHGDINERNTPLDQMVCVRPILESKPGADSGDFQPFMPDTALATDLVHRAVQELRNHTPSIVVINFSVCDPSHPFVREISPLARLLDWLSFEHNLLFVVSAGNHSPDIPIFNNRLDLPKEKTTINALESLQKEKMRRRLLSPAETINGITVGAIQFDASDIDYKSSNLIDPFEGMGLPGLYSAHGPGFRRSIKPDLLLPGGRVVYRDVTGGENQIRKARFKLIGQEVAFPGDSTGVLNNTRGSFGTSNATALASRSAAMLHDVLEQLRENNPDRIPKEYDAVLLKSLLVHGTGWKNFEEHYSLFCNISGWSPSKEELAHNLGHGEFDHSSVASCKINRATVLGCGTIATTAGHKFFLPLPITAYNNTFRIVVTLAWLTPVNPFHQNYRGKRLWFDLSNFSNIKLKGYRHTHHATRRGTVQHEIFVTSGLPADPENPEGVIEIYCKPDADKKQIPIRYGLAVTLEVLDESSIDIYNAIKNQLAVSVEA